MREYSKKRATYLAEHQKCGICKQHDTTDIHHMRGRVKARLNDEQFWIPVCRECHRHIHDNPAWAYEHGYLLRDSK